MSEKEKIYATLNARQRDIVNYLIKHIQTNRKNILNHLLNLGHFKGISYNSADRVMRAEINDIINIGVPICTNSQDGYVLGGAYEVAHALAELRSRRSSIEAREAALRRASALWFSKPAKAYQPTLFKIESKAEEANKYIPEGRI